LNRVVITGMGVISALGNNVISLMKNIELGLSSVQYMIEWNQYKGLHSLIGAPSILENEKSIPRKNRRSMGKLSIFAAQATERAFVDSNLENEMLSSGRLGCVIGSTMGSAESLTEAFEIMLPDKDISQLSSMKFFQCLSHTAAMNVAQYFGIKGSVIAPSAACASSLQAIGIGYDLIRLGKQSAVICGGSEELHPSVTGSFDILYATSTKYNDRPTLSPRPFDKDRDGLVCGDGAGIVVLENYENALARNAKIYAEVIGYHTCGSGSHISQSEKNSISFCISEALKSANISPTDVNYICGHGTATIQGDKEEAEAIKEVFGDSVPVNSLKGYIGHTLGASGAIELISAIKMMEVDTIYPTLNLENISPDCKGIFHVKGKPIKKNINFFIKNCFAFGGINAVLVCKNMND